MFPTLTETSCRNVIDAESEQTIQMARSAASLGGLRSMRTSCFNLSLSAVGLERVPTNDHFYKLKADLRLVANRASPGTGRPCCRLQHHCPTSTIVRTNLFKWLGAYMFISCLVDCHDRTAKRFLVLRDVIPSTMCMMPKS